MLVHWTVSVFHSFQVFDSLVPWVCCLWSWRAEMAGRFGDWQVGSSWAIV